MLVGGDHRVSSEVLAAGSLATAGLWLGSAVTVRRRERSRTEKTPAEEPSLATGLRRPVELTCVHGPVSGLVRCCRSSLLSWLLTDSATAGLSPDKLHEYSQCCGYHCARSHDILQNVTWWKCLRASFQDVGRHRWWRRPLVTFYAAYGLARLIPALHGWPLTITSGALDLTDLAVTVDLVITYCRRLAVARAGESG